MYELMIKQLNEQTFLEMLLKSKASRNENRFYAVLPSTQYKEKLKNKDVVSSWQIESMVSVKLKLYEWMTTKEKLDLFFISSYYESVDLNPISPTFATSNIYWDGTYVKYPPKDAFHLHCNFDLDNKDTIQLIHDNMYCLNVKPKKYYKADAAFKKDYFNSQYTDYETLCQRFQLDTPNDLDIIYIPPFDNTNYVDLEDSGFVWHDSIVILIGRMAKFKWEIHKLRPTPPGLESDLEWQCYQCDDHHVGFNIY